MQLHELKSLSKVRFEHALDVLNEAKLLLSNNNYKGAANRSYYAAFHAMRAVLAFDEIDMKRHSGILSSFQRLYIKTGIFEKEFSDILTILFEIRTNSDYDDYYIVSKEKVTQQVENAELFINKVKEFLDAK